ncbi:hypothetical protein GCM10009624_01120 [Gordonia sinesedis]
MSSGVSPLPPALPAVVRPDIGRCWSRSRTMRAMTSDTTNDTIPHAVTTSAKVSQDTPLIVAGNSFPVQHSFAATVESRDDRSR